MVQYTICTGPERKARLIEFEIIKSVELCGPQVLLLELPVIMSSTNQNQNKNNHNQYNKFCEPPMKCKLFPTPAIHRGIRWAKVHVKNAIDGSIQTELVWLIRSDTNAHVAYRKLLTKPPIHSPSNTCIIVPCVVLTRVQDVQGSNVLFEEPPPPPEDDDEDDNSNDDDMYRHLVCVKKYKKRSIPSTTTTTSDFHVKDGHVLQTLGNQQQQNGSIPQALDILEDDQYVYIVCPYPRFGSLEENLFLHTPSSLLGGTPNIIRHREQKVKVIFRHLFKVIHKLHDHHVICHFNLCPSTIFVNEDDTLPSSSSSSSLSSSSNSCKLILDDFALSLMYPTSTTTTTSSSTTTNKQRRHWIVPQESILQKQKEYLAPELYTKKKFDGPTVDIWVAGVLLFNLLTGHKLYDFPSQIDPIFAHVITNGGLINKDNINERTLDALLNNDNKDIKHRNRRNPSFPSSTTTSSTERLVEIIFALDSLSFGAKSLMQGMLQINPNERFSAEDVLHHPWMTIR